MEIEKALKSRDILNKSEELQFIRYKIEQILMDDLSDVALSEILSSKIGNAFNEVQTNLLQELDNL